MNSTITHYEKCQFSVRTDRKSALHVARRQYLSVLPSGNALNDGDLKPKRGTIIFAIQSNRIIAATNNKIINLQNNIPESSIDLMNVSVFFESKYMSLMSENIFCIHKLNDTPRFCYEAVPDENRLITISNYPITAPAMTH